MSDGQTFRDPFEPMRKTMSLALPMILADRRLKQDKARADREFLFKKMKLLKEVEDTKIKFATSLYDKFIEAGSVEGVQTIAPFLEGVGLPVPREEPTPTGRPSQLLDVPGMKLGDYFVPKKRPSSINQALAWLHQGDSATLTGLLRASKASTGRLDPDLALARDLKKILEKKGMDLNELILLSYMPDSPEKDLFTGQINKGLPENEKELLKLVNRKLLRHFGGKPQQESLGLPPPAPKSSLSKTPNKQAFLKKWGLRVK